MGRPLKNNIIYFSHDCEAWRNGKFEALRAHYPGEKGWAMEGRFWALNCMIGEAEGCRLDIRRVIFRADIARKIGLSVEEFDEFVAFLSDPDACDLLNLEDGVLWTDRTQEELGRVQRSRDRDRGRKSSFPGGIQTEKGDIRADSNRKTGFSGRIPPDSGAFRTAEQSRAEHTVQEQSSSSSPADAALFVSLLKTRLAAEGLSLQASDFDACASRLIASPGCDGFLDYALERCRKAKQPTTWFVKGVLEWDWIGKWRVDKGPHLGSNGKQELTQEERDRQEKAGLLRSARLNQKAGVKLTKLEEVALAEVGELAAAPGPAVFPEGDAS